MHDGNSLWNKLLDQIDSRGWAWQTVGPDQGDDEHEPFPHYCYTVGLVSKGLPDLIIVGLDIQTSISVGDELIIRALGLDAPGRAVPTAAGPHPFNVNEELLDVFKGSRAMLVDVPPPQAAKRSLFAHDYAEAVSKAPDLIQLVWPDRNGRLPFEEGAAPSFAEAQPVLKYATPTDPNQADTPVMQ